MKNKAFTFIELLVVATIISLLAGAGAVSYSAFSKQSRDAKRKADLEQVRAALEMYRSNNNVYITGTWASLSGNPGLTTPTVFLQSLPTDPKSASYNYYYNGSSTDYTLGTFLESGGTNCSGNPSCGASTCNYCLGPYGQK